MLEWILTLPGFGFLQGWLWMLQEELAGVCGHVEAARWGKTESTVLGGLLAMLVFLIWAARLLDRVRAHRPSRRGSVAPWQQRFTP